MNEQELFIKKLSGIDTFAAGKDGILTETEIQHLRRLVRELAYASALVEVNA